MLRKKASVDDRLGQLTDGACLLYVLSIPHLDVEGRMDGDPGAVWGTVATCRRRRHPHWTVEAVEGFLTEWTRTLDEDGHPSPLVLWYCVRGHWVCEFLGFKKNQALRADREAPSRFPAPPEDLLSTVAPHAVAAWDADPEDETGPDAVPGPHGERLFPIETPAAASTAGNDRFEQTPEPLRSEAEVEVQVQEPPLAAAEVGDQSARARGEPRPLGIILREFENLFGCPPRLADAKRDRLARAVDTVGVDATTGLMRERKMAGTTPRSIAFFLPALEERAAELRAGMRVDERAAVRAATLTPKARVERWWKATGQFLRDEDFEDVLPELCGWDEAMRERARALRYANARVA